jgi:hypothetical protein
MEVAVLTTRLEAQISAFQSQMAAAERMLKEVQKVMRDLEKTTIELQETMKKLGVDASQMDKSIGKLKELGNQVGDLRTKFLEANKAANDLSVSPTRTAKNIAEINAQTEAVKRLTDAEIEAQLASLRVQTRSSSGLFGRNAIPLAAASGGVGGMQDYRDYMTRLVQSQGGARLGPMTQAEAILRGWSPPGPLTGSQILSRRLGETEAHRSYGATREAEYGVSFLRNIGRFFSGGGGNARRGIGNFFGGGGPGGFFQGILPGGRRAGAGAVLTGLGLAAAAGPAIGVGAGGLAGALPNMLGTLVGAGATLKLAFADISAAAFTSKAAFDALTPVQRSFVQNLRSIDVGFTKPLERLAQNNLLPKLTSAINSALTPSSIGAAGSIVTAFSNSLGTGAKTIGKFLGSSGFDRQLQQMMIGDAAGIEKLATAFTHILDAVVRIGNAALPFTNWLENVGVKASKAADAFIKTQQATGGLASFFDRAKSSLQAIAGLLGSIGRAIGALGNAISLKNSIDLIRLVSKLFQDLADLLNGNRQLFNNFLHGMIKATGDLLAVLKSLIGAFLTLLSGINSIIQPLSRLTGGLIGVRGAIDSILLLLTTRWVVGWLGALDKTVAAVGTVRASLLKLALLRIVIPVVILSTIKGPVEAIWHKLFGGATIGSLPDFSNSVDNIKTPNWPDVRVFDPSVAGSKTHGFVRYPKGTSGYDDYRAGYMGMLPPDGNTNSPAYVQGWKAGQTARSVAAIKAGKGLPFGGDAIGGFNPKGSARPGHGKPSPFDQTGGLGFAGPTSAGGAVFNAQQAVSQAMTTGSGASFGQQLALARAYERSAAKAYEHLKNQTVALKDQTKKRAELTTLARAQASAERDIARILDHQAKALAKAVEDSRKLQITQHQTAISSIRSNLTSGFSAAATPSAALAVVNHALRAAGNQMVQLKTLKDKLLGQDKQTVQLKNDENRVQKEINATQETINKAQKDQAKALKAQVAAGINRKWEKIFGIGSGQTASIESVVRAEHSALTQILRHLPHAKGVNPMSLIPGFANMTLQQQVKALESHGVHFSKQALKDFERIRGYLAEIKASGAKMDPAIRGKITDLLTQIKNNTDPKKQAIPSYHLASVKDVMKTLTAIHDPAKRKAAAQRLMEMEIYGGHLPIGPAVAGIPVRHSGQNVIMQGNTTIVIQGYEKDPKVLAAEVRNALLKTKRRNTTQTRGPNAGKNLGMT